jgi:polyphosphate kinase
MLAPPSSDGRDASTASTSEVNDMAKKKHKQHHAQVPASPSAASREATADPPVKLKRKDYEREMRRLHGELVAMQEWLTSSRP